MTITKYTVIIVDSAPDFFIVKCGNCNGGGCSKCDYAGKRKLIVPPDWSGRDIGLVKCGNCNGGGCSECNYVGAHVGCYPRVVCGNCNGGGCNPCSYRGSRWIHSLI